MVTELWSLKEKRVYTEQNATRVTIGNVAILATPKGEPLVMRAR